MSEGIATPWRLNRYRAFYPAMILCLLVGHALTLHAMGRVPWCQCGPGLWTPHAYSSDTSQHLLDPYSFTHIIHGIVFYATLRWLTRGWPVGRCLVAATAIEIAWELLENAPPIIARYRAATISLDYTGDSILNSLGDVGCAMVGFGLTRALPVRWTLALILLIELTLLATIRDNLTLNILMLILPIPGVKAWQAGH